jgi:hypothetical protein
VDLDLASNLERARLPGIKFDHFGTPLSLGADVMPEAEILIPLLIGKPRSFRFVAIQDNKPQK